MAAIREVPRALRGPMAPMRFEATVEECLVSEGEVPRDLNGGFYRNGPTWKRPSRQGVETPYSMDAMVQGLVFRDGRVDFRNRWVRTPKYLAEERHGEAIFEWSDGAFGDWRAWALGDVVRDERTTGVPQGTNAVNVVPFAGGVLALGEACAPVALDPVTLETRGVVGWAGQLSEGMVPRAADTDGAMAAHPKWDAATGELYAWTYRDKPPYVTLHWVTPGGTVRSRDLQEAPYNTVAHDVWLTERYVVIPFQPFVVSQERIGQGRSAYGWDPELPIRLALVPRDDIDGQVRWIDGDMGPQYVMHMLSANHVGDTIVLDAPIFDRPPFQFDDRFRPGDGFEPFWKLATSCTGRWVVDLERGTATSEALDDRPVELPKVDERHYGRPYEWAFMVAGEPKADGGMRMNSIVRRNVRTGREDVYKVDSERHVGVYEATFAPRAPDSPEGDGYLIVPVARFAEARSEFLILDTSDVTAGPIARIELPFQIGWTPHGHWMGFE